tara:strand:+ start:478 stop:768 length:291 start_codon:yes stop_codon:yes gene_type:complete
MALKDSKDFIKFVKTFSCGLCATVPVDAHHLDSVGMGGNRMEVIIEDYSCVPLCRVHHQEWHQIGDREFLKKYNLNLWKLNYQMNKLWRKQNAQEN